MLVRVTRGEISDLVYRGHIVVAGPGGQVLYQHGDRKLLVFPRSATKALQALVALETGALDHYRISDKELALMCGSHGGTKEHVETLKSILAKAGLDESYLRCGSHYPLDKKAREAMRKRGEKPSPSHNNCSAKHAAMLLSAKYLGEDLASYMEIDHPHQGRILALLSDFTDYKKEDFKLAIDGCGVPVHAAPMENWARAYARFAGEDFFPEKRAENIRRIKTALKTHPQMVSSRGLLCTDLLEASQNLFPKLGAGAFYSLALEKEELGVVIKIESGKEEILAPIILKVLEDLGVPLDKKPLEKHLNQKILNHQGQLVGQVLVDFQLEKVL